MIRRGGVFLSLLAGLLLTPFVAHAQATGTISGRVSANPDYCTDKKSAEIKADLTRHLAGDYTPNLPKPKVETSCGGLFGGPCDSGQTDEKFEAKKFYDELDKRKPVR